MSRYIDLGLDTEEPFLSVLVDTVSGGIGCHTKKQKSCLRCLLANLLHCPTLPIGVKRAKCSHGPIRYNPHGVGYGPLRRVLDGLAAANWIAQEVGVAAKCVENRATTTIQGTEQLLQEAARCGWVHFSVEWVRRDEVVRLKDDQSNLIDYKDNDFTERVRSHLNAFNALLAETDICVGFDPVGGDRARRTFLRGSFEKGGRLWGPWCQLGKAQRNELCIDGESTVELDYTAAHVNALYQFETSRWYPFADDPYDVTVGTVTIPREITKALIIRAPNVTGLSSLGRIFLNEFRDDAIFRALQVRPADIMNAFLCKHPAIARHYLQGDDHGLWVQFLESEMLFAVVVELTKMRIPSLPVYDAVYVPESNAELARQVMCNVHNQLPDRSVSKTLVPQTYRPLYGVYGVKYRSGLVDPIRSPQIRSERASV